RAMRAISDIRPNWLFDASLMMGTTCPRIALMYSMLVAPQIKARLVGATQVRPMQRRSLGTPTQRRTTLARTRAAWQDTELAGIQSAGMPDIAGGCGCFGFSRPPSTLRAARYRELRCPCASRDRQSTARWSCDP